MTKRKQDWPFESRGRAGLVVVPNALLEIGLSPPAIVAAEWLVGHTVEYRENVVTMRLMASRLQWSWQRARDAVEELLPFGWLTIEKEQATRTRERWKFIVDLDAWREWSDGLEQTLRDARRRAEAEHDPCDDRARKLSTTAETPRAETEHDRADIAHDGAQESRTDLAKIAHTENHSENQTEEHSDLASPASPSAADAEELSAPEVIPGAVLPPIRTGTKNEPLDRIFQALVAACQWKYSEMTEVARRQTMVAARQLLGLETPPTQTEIAKRTARLRAKWPKIDPSPTAISKHWQSLGEPATTRAEASLRNPLARHQEPPQGRTA